MYYSLKRSRYLVDQGYNYEVVPYDCPVQMLGEEPRWKWTKGARSALDAESVSPQVSQRVAFVLVLVLLVLLLLIFFCLSPQTVARARNS